MADQTHTLRLAKPCSSWRGHACEIHTSAGATRYLTAERPIFAALPELYAHSTRCFPALRSNLLQYPTSAAHALRTLLAQPAPSAALLPKRICRPRHRLLPPPRPLPLISVLAQKLTSSLLRVSRTLCEQSRTFASILRQIRISWTIPVSAAVSKTCRRTFPHSLRIHTLQHPRVVSASTPDASFFLGNDR